MGREHRKLTTCSFAVETHKEFGKFQLITTESSLATELLSNIMRQNMF